MFTIKIAVHPSRCHACETKILRGDAYLEGSDGNRYCFCQLPKRRLVPLKQVSNVVKTEK